MFPKTTKVLLAEPSPITRRVIRTMLERLGFTNFHAVSDGPAADLEIRMYLGAGTAYGLVIANHDLPRMSGVELLGRLRADRRTVHLPVILLATDNEKERVLEAIRAGVTAYLAAPFSLEALESKMREAWESLQKRAA